MAMLEGPVQKQVRDVLAGLGAPVTLAVFTLRDEAGEPDEGSQELTQLVRELAALSGGRVSAEFFDLDGDATQADAYGVDKAPAIVVLGGESGRRDFGIRYFGVPAGYEFSTLIEDIRLASSARSGLSPATVDALSRLTEPLHLQVFVTPSCPYCPRAVLLAHRMAVESTLVTADAIDATAFPELAEQYRVRGVPRTVANEIVHVEGAVPEAMLVAELTPLLRRTA